MKKVKLKIAIVSALGLTASHVFATGFVALPNTGFSVSGGTSAYTLCNTTGNFGSGYSVNPTLSANNTCAVFPITQLHSPGDPANYTGARLFPVATHSSSIIVNNTYTGNVNKNIGILRDLLWRSNDDSECIYGVHVQLNTTDYNPVAGNQYFEVNDVARGGWDGVDVSIAYSTIPTNASPVYRAGLTYTSVQHRPGDVDQPLTGLGSQPSINGLNSWPGNASAAQQLADIDANWVVFTTQASNLIIGGHSSQNSSSFYVKSDICPATPYTPAANAIRLRQTYQKSGMPFIEISLPGFAPAGAVFTPTHTDPY